jgi:hypothetical protein
MQGTHKWSDASYQEEIQLEIAAHVECHTGKEHILTGKLARSIFGSESLMITEEYYGYI